MLRDIAWVAVAAAACLVLGVLTALAGCLTKDWYTLAYGGVLVLAGVGGVMLSMREDR